MMLYAYLASVLCFHSVHACLPSCTIISFVNCCRLLWCYLQNGLQYVYSEASWLLPATLWQVQRILWRVHQFSGEDADPGVPWLGRRWFSLHSMKKYLSHGYWFIIVESTINLNYNRIMFFWNGNFYPFRWKYRRNISISRMKRMTARNISHVMAATPTIS